MRSVVPVALVAVLGTVSAAPATDRAGASTVAQAAEGASTSLPATQAPVMTGIPATTSSTRAGVNLIPEQQEGELLSSDLVGQLVYDSAGARVGTVTDLLLDRERRLSAIVASLEGGQRRIAIPFEAVRRTSSEGHEVRLVVNVDPAALRKAKSFESLSKEASQDDNQDLTGRGTATGGSVPPVR